MRSRASAKITLHCTIVIRKRSPPLWKVQPCAKVFKSSSITRQLFASIWPKPVPYSVPAFCKLTTAASAAVAAVQQWNLFFSECSRDRIGSEFKTTKLRGTVEVTVHSKSPLQARAGSQRGEAIDEEGEDDGGRERNLLRNDSHRVDR